MRLKQANRFLVYLLLLLGTADLALFGALLKVKRSVTEDHHEVLRNGVLTDYSARPIGYSAHDLPIQGSSSAKGWIVRYSSKNCHYCLQDEPLWDQLSRQLATSAYDMEIIVPRANEVDSNLTDNDQEAFVDLAWLKEFRLTVTPTIIVFSKKKGLLWSHRGTLSPKNLNDIVLAINCAERTTGCKL